jgi:uncharacterized CHY-type Zn-finger protein
VKRLSRLTRYFVTGCEDSKNHRSAIAAQASKLFLEWIATRVDNSSATDTEDVAITNVGTKLAKLTAAQIIGYLIDTDSMVYDMSPPAAPVHGVDLDPQTRCRHYHGRADIVAIKMKCCGEYFACKDCHAALADHPIEPWPTSEWNEQAILCGACGARLTIDQYMNGESRCPACHELFNPGCRKHYHYYFQTP